MINYLLICACIVSSIVVLDVVAFSIYYVMKYLSRFTLVRKETIIEESTQEETQETPKMICGPTYDNPHIVRVRMRVPNDMTEEEVYKMIENMLSNGK